MSPHGVTSCFFSVHIYKIQFASLNGPNNHVLSASANQPVGVYRAVTKSVICLKWLVLTREIQRKEMAMFNNGKCLQDFGNKLHRKTNACDNFEVIQICAKFGGEDRMKYLGYRVKRMFVFTQNGSLYIWWMFFLKVTICAPSVQLLHLQIIS